MKQLINPFEEEDLYKRWIRINSLYDDLSLMFMRWRDGKIIKHIDLGMLERLITERNDLDRNLMIANDTIKALNNKLAQNESLLKHFTPEDAEVIRQRVQARLHDPAKLEMEAMPEVLSK